MENGTHAQGMNLTLRVWRQKKGQAGHFETYQVSDISDDSSFLEMLDILNEQLIEDGLEPVAFDHDCREGICGMCSLTINGVPQGPENRTTACQLHMRSFHDGQTITIEPFRAEAFPVVKDLVTDRSSLDRVVEAGGYISIRSGSAPDGNAIPIPKRDADYAMDAAACIGCGACVAACPNASAMLFTSAKVSHLNALPQGRVEKGKRAVDMVRMMDEQGFGNCTNYGECQAVCPKGITLDFIAQLNRDYAAGSVSRIFAKAG